MRSEELPYAQPRRLAGFSVSTVPTRSTLDATICSVLIILHKCRQIKHQLSQIISKLMARQRDDVFSRFQTSYEINSCGAFC